MMGKCWGAGSLILCIQKVSEKHTVNFFLCVCGSYLYGMHSFGLVETNLFDEAERVSRKGLELNPRDAWSTHSLAHVLEMTGRPHEGISFLSTTVQDWAVREH